MAEAILRTPASAQDVLALRAGDRILLSGTVYTARDAAHRRMVELIESGGELPFELSGAAIYYCGPAPAPPGRVIGSAGPTTSGRMDGYAPLLISRGLRVMIGKGPRGEGVLEAMRRHGAVYLAAPGGAGALLARCITACELVAWPELGPEAVRRLTVKDMPLITACDAHGGNLYVTGPEACLARMKTKETKD